MFKNALVLPPAENFAQGLTSAHLGAPVYEKALVQHERYCEALTRCGFEVIRLDKDPLHPDSTFVEDTAVLFGRCAVLTRPGAVSRRGEVASIGRALSGRYASFYTITPPGTLDGGDVCEAGLHFFIGISKRTNPEGGRQLSVFLEQEGYTCDLVDIRKMKGLLHLKSGMAYLGDNRMVVIDALAERPEFRAYERIRVKSTENYAANCVWVNGHILTADGFPELAGTLEALGYDLLSLEMSEFQKMDGGLSCLSLRF